MVPWLCKALVCEPDMIREQSPVGRTWRLVRGSLPLTTRESTLCCTLGCVPTCFSLHWAGLSCTSTAVWSERRVARIEAMLSILKTWFVIIVLGAAALMFTRDAEVLVIGPIEHMVLMAKALADDPSGRASAGAVLGINRVQPRARMKPWSTLSAHSLVLRVTQTGFVSEHVGMCSNHLFGWAALKGEHSAMETQLIEQTLTSIGALLHVGFGEAGSLIIADRIRHGGSVDLNAAGKRVTGVFGFCDIRYLGSLCVCADRVCQYGRTAPDSCQPCGSFAICRRWICCTHPAQRPSTRLPVQFHQ